MIDVTKIQTAKQAASKIAQAVNSEVKASASASAFFRAMVSTDETRELLAQGMQAHCRTKDQRNSKCPESATFYKARTILGNKKRMTDPETGEYAGHFSVKTDAKNGVTRDADGNLTSAPVLIPKTDGPVAPKSREVADADALASFLKWFEGRSITFKSALLNTDAQALRVAMNEAYEAHAARDIAKEAALANAKLADEQQDPTLEAMEANAENIGKQSANG